MILFVSLLSHHPLSLFILYFPLVVFIQGFVVIMIGNVPQVTSHSSAPHITLVYNSDTSRRHSSLRAFISKLVNEALIKPQ